MCSLLILYTVYGFEPGFVEGRGLLHSPLSQAEFDSDVVNSFKNKKLSVIEQTE